MIRIALFLCAGCFLICSECFAQQRNILHKKYLVKFDPASALVNEFRMTYDRRWEMNQRERVKEKSKVLGGNFFFASPFVMHKKILGRHPSPDTLAERHSGIGIRAGVRHFLFNDFESHGFYLLLGGLYRFRHVKFTGANSESGGNTIIQSPGALAAFGYQINTSPWKEIAIGGSAGIEYQHNFYERGFDKGDFFRNWYQLPILDEFRIFISLEVGFSFRQKNRHW